MILYLQHFLSFCVFFLLFVFSSTECQFRNSGNLNLGFKPVDIFQLEESLNKATP